MRADRENGKTELTIEMARGILAKTAELEVLMAKGDKLRARAVARRVAEVAGERGAAPVPRRDV
jgi:hypothetical protein